MGPKISIDSATLMNKGLEVIEAHHLFGIGYDRIDVVIHPQSVVHSMVEFIDGSMKAHLGRTDMRIPIQYALSYPGRLEGPLPPLDLVETAALTFEAPDPETFAALPLAYVAGRAGGTAPAVLNAANEEAVAAFLDGHCAFLDITDTVALAVEAHEVQPADSLEALFEADSWARELVRKRITWKS
jgi:1-deoxy-D-xylulose-5-phosphate reductoisomerase